MASTDPWFLQKREIWSLFLACGCQSSSLGLLGKWLMKSISCLLNQCWVSHWVTRWWSQYEVKSRNIPFCCFLYKLFGENVMNWHQKISAWGENMCNGRCLLILAPLWAWLLLSSESLCLVILSSCSCHSLSLSLLLNPGSKAAPRPGGIGSAAAGQPGMEGEGMLSKILPGGAAEQAGKLGEGTTNTPETQCLYKLLYNVNNFSYVSVNEDQEWVTLSNWRLNKSTRGIHQTLTCLIELLSDNWKQIKWQHRIQISKILMIQDNDGEMSKHDTEMRDDKSGRKGLKRSTSP